MRLSICCVPSHNRIANGGSCSTWAWPPEHIRPGTIKENARAKEQAAKQSERLRPILAAMTAQGASLRTMANALASAGTTTAKGLPLSATQVGRHLMRLGLTAE